MKICIPKLNFRNSPLIKYQMTNSSTFSSTLSKPLFDVYEQPSILTDTKIYIVDLRVPGVVLFMGRIGGIGGNENNDESDLDFEDDRFTDNLVFWLDEDEGKDKDKDRGKKIKSKMSMKDVLEEVETLIEGFSSSFFPSDHLFLFVDDKERQTKIDMLERVHTDLMKMTVDLYRDFVASRRIQRVWRKVIANPTFQVCRKRLRYEFEEMKDDF